MKKIVVFFLTMILLFGCIACGSKKDETQGSKLSEEEQQLVEILKIISKDFNAPGEVRLLEIGDAGTYMSYLLPDMGTGEFEGVVVRLQGQTKAGGISSGVYLIRLDPVKTNSAWEAAEKEFDDRMDYWVEQWNEKPDDDWSRKQYKTFDAYRANMIEFYYDNYVFASEIEALTAAVSSFDFTQEEWNATSADDYPRSYFDSYDAYKTWYIYSYKLPDYLYPYPDKYDVKEVYLYREIEDGTVKNSAEDVYDISEINKALKSYWDERLGN